MAEIVKTCKGKDALKHDGFLYYINSKKKNGDQAWICSHSACNVRAISKKKEDGTLDVQLKSEHGHPPPVDKIKTMIEKENMKQQALLHPDASAMNLIGNAPASQIKNDTMKKIV